MKIYNSYILAVAVLLMLTTVIMVAIGVDSLDTYYMFYIIGALFVTELYVYFNTKARRGLSLVGGILFGGFILAISLQVVEYFV